MKKILNLLTIYLILGCSKSDIKPDDGKVHCYTYTFICSDRKDSREIVCDLFENDSQTLLKEYELHTDEPSICKVTKRKND